MKRIAVVVLGVLLATAAFAGGPLAGQAPSITPAELSKLREEGRAPVVIDVRSPAEFAAGHVPGALNIPYEVVALKISEVEAPNGVALYCMVGPRARRGEAALLEAGTESVLHLEGGLAAWKKAGLPVETGQASD